MYSGTDRYLTDKKHDELYLRKKQLLNLVGQGGFICFLMEKPLTNKDFDLIKEVFGFYNQLYFDGTRAATFLKPRYGELKNYCDTYGVAHNKFSYYGSADYKRLISSSSYDGDVGIGLDNSFFFIPCHTVEKDVEEVENLFSLLSKGFVSMYRKFLQEPPSWTNEFKFSDEEQLLETRTQLESELDELNERLGLFQLHKRLLAFSGEALREATISFLRSALKLNIDEEDNYREDLSLLNEGGELVALIEVKGVNGNFSRSAINQVDSHRERQELEENFPGILIANTFIKTSNSIEDKDQAPDGEQVKHAKKQHVLLLRTIDLLRAFDAVQLEKLSRQDFLDLLISKVGWLEFKEDRSYELH